MSKKDKLFESYNGPPWKQATFDDLAKLLTDSGFIQADAVGGSHYKFTHDDLPYHVELPKHKELGKIYTKKVIEAIKAIK